MSNDKRLEALERRLAEAEEEIRILRARVAELEENKPRRILRADITAVAAELQSDLLPLLQQIGDITDRMAQWSANLKAVEARQEAEARRVTALFEERANELSTAALLDTYEQRIEPAGQELKAWLRSINAEQRYRAVIALRARRQKSSDKSQT